MTALLLAGGMGTRIRHIHPDLPKPMIPIAGYPFLEWAVRYWAGQGIRRFVISLGHLAETAQAYFQSRPDDGLEIKTIVEPGAMGTGGAVQFAASMTHLSDPFVVANGDSLVFADTSEAQQLIAQPDTSAVVLGVRVSDTSRYGSLAVQTHKLLGFREKQPGSGVINAGVYFFRRSTVDSFPSQSPLSMELDVFPTLLAAGKSIQVSSVDAPFLDIGTPESLSQAEAFIRANFGQPS